MSSDGRRIAALAPRATDFRPVRFPASPAVASGEGHRLFSRSPQLASAALTARQSISDIPRRNTQRGIDNTTRCASDKDADSVLLPPCLTKPGAIPVRRPFHLWTGLFKRLGFWPAIGRYASPPRKRYRTSRRLRLERLGPRRLLTLDLRGASVALGIARSDDDGPRSVDPLRQDFGRRRACFERFGRARAKPRCGCRVHRTTRSADAHRRIAARRSSGCQSRRRGRTRPYFGNSEGQSLWVRCDPQPQNPQVP